MTSLSEQLDSLLEEHPSVLVNPPRKDLIRRAVENKEAVVSAMGALATWTPPESTGRSPKDTVIVRRASSEGNIDWDSPNNLSIEESTFDMLFADALEALSQRPVLVTDRVVGADSRYALPVRTVADNAVTQLFADNMFRPVPADLSRSVFVNKPFTLVVVPYDKLDPVRYEGRLRLDPDTGVTSDMAIAMDFDRRVGVVFGSAYCGSCKKMIFTAMNYYLPAESILPLHCSSNEGPDGDCALLLGLSGTGKTTLSADPRRALLGDDEHGWSTVGVANFENGCYAKLINLDPDKEPEIFNACFHLADWQEHGAIIENCLMYPNGSFDVDDERLTPNSRGSYPLTYLSNIKESSTSGHPKTILFLTADANGVLPPVSRLTEEQAMLWFLMGYTSKLAGTETGITEPRTTFSRFFGEPFMPRNPDVYARMLGEKLRKHATQVYLVNTGWTGGPYGVGARIDIKVTREIVQACLTGGLKDVEYDQDPLFMVEVPRTCPGVEDASILVPKNTWLNKDEYDKRAARLAAEFAAHFDKAYGEKGIDKAVADQCPGTWQHS
jgi:phosphoenolpyruvate carboxykinase (ATP)